ncbi:DUF5067 domain-containing protein [Vagococcus bubulae]|uniref:DUF5067 domain-containing protein n=1 Tax=Vagococcus bubulae TaxID=1977868 RepID=A0A429ZDZ1_9ENTE|nr:DUF5067 domain-containing protein [Vagococcus bubulae]RST91910.1 hypothetical protein CBF36_09300 [Vagococcus bubulae]
MNKKILLSLLLPLSLLLTSCSNNNEVTTKETVNTSIKNEKIPTKTNFDGYAFKDSLLETPDFDLKIDKTQTGEAYNSEGIIVWFTLTNKSDRNIVPKEAFSNMLEITQQDDTSVYNIPTDYNYLNAAEMLYPTNDKSIEDPEYVTNNELQEKYNNEYDKKFFAELLPGKEIKTAVALTLETPGYPIFINIAEPYATLLNTSPLKIETT